MPVIDASVAVKVSLAETGFDRLRSEDLSAPPLLLSEASSALHELAWRQSVTRRLASEAFGRLLSAPIEIRRPERLSRDAWDVAELLGWAKTYDAEYVALARMLDRPLLTLDARLARAARQLVQVLSPSEL